MTKTEYDQIKRAIDVMGGCNINGDRHIPAQNVIYVLTAFIDVPSSYPEDSQESTPSGASSDEETR